MTIDTIAMAREAGFVLEGDLSGAGRLPMLLERFYALARAQTLEECTVAVESAILRMLDPRQTASECLDAIRALKDQPGHSAAADAGASTAPLPEGEAATARELAAMFRQFTKSSHRWHDGRSVHIVAAEVLERVANATGWPAGLLDRVKAAAKRIDDNRAPRSIPADPHSDVDLVLAEVRCFLEGSAPPFWVPGAPRCRSADTARHGSDEQAESASLSVLLIRGEK